MIGVNILAKSVPTSAQDGKYLSSPNLPEEGIEYHIFKPYGSYPVSMQAGQNVLILLEGFVHGIVTSSVLNALEAALHHEEISASKIRQLIANWSGDYTIYIYIAGKWWVFTDPLGRLPVYYVADPDFFFAGRSLRFLFTQYKRMPDPDGVMAAIWCGYPIGENTLYQQVKRLPAHATLEYNFLTRQSNVSGEPLINLEQQVEQNIDHAAIELADLFRQACNRIETSIPFHKFVSLSGGQDSRCVAWGFKQAASQIDCGSFGGPGYEADLELAKFISASMELPFQEYNLSLQPTDEQALLLNKQGHNYLGMSFILDFYRQIRENFGDELLYLTGDGADSSLCYLGEARADISNDHLVQKLLHRHSNFPLKVIEGITGRSIDDLSQQVHQIISAYPEKEANNKSYHYTIFERGGRFFWEGEDRSRFYFWATTPFYDLDFFHRARTVPHRLKRSYHFYRKFQLALYPPLTHIRDASGHTINHPMYRFRRGVQENFRSTSASIKSLIRDVERIATGKKREVGDHLKMDLRNSLQPDNQLNGLFDMDYLQQALAKADLRQTRFLRTIILALNLK